MCYNKANEFVGGVTLRRVSRKLPAVFVITVLTILLIVAVISTILLALFSVSKKATVTLTFADNVAVEVDGISGTSSNYNWKIGTKDGTTTTYIVDGTTVTAPFFENVGVKVTSGATSTTPVTVRVFAIVYTTNSTIQSISASSGVTTVASANYTTQESGLISSVPSGAKYSAICVMKEFTANASAFTDMINEFYPLGSELTSSNMGAKTQGIVVITAKNRSTATGQTISTADWNSIVDFSASNIKWD